MIFFSITEHNASVDTRIVEHERYNYKTMDVMREGESMGEAEK